MDDYINKLFFSNSLSEFVINLIILWAIVLIPLFLQLYTCFKLDRIVFKISPFIIATALVLVCSKLFYGELIYVFSTYLLYGTLIGGFIYIIYILLKKIEK